MRPDKTIPSQAGDDKRLQPTIPVAKKESHKHIFATYTESFKP